jgi:hypothetical protein
MQMHDTALPPSKVVYKTCPFCYRTFYTIGRQLKLLEGKAAAVTDAVVLLFSGSILFAGLLLLHNGEIAFS